MNLAALYMATALAACAVPFAIISTLKDLTLRQGVVLMSTIVIVCTICIFLPLRLDRIIILWLHSPWKLFLALCCLGAVILLISVARKIRKKKLLTNLNWPASLTQRQMEIFGTRYLQLNGWLIESYPVSVHFSRFKVSKAGSVLHVIFLRDSYSYGALLRYLSKTRGLSLHLIRILVFDQLTPTMISAAQEAKVLIANYHALAEMTSATNETSAGKGKQSLGSQ